ncbi:hypothetical protein BZA05DRAFT_465310 [Tricharina praecox]|uniref:uncharacterized protein n=1 Tax=Tricharina praecox TaxID=43433 RepID=UPI00221F9495|nr:uncharacterized protein BZA05DRAFT_465310 [Tricharina praecox]KAI5856111.1 hypothetical protein BZA05DRAFT_465310 [Tricharina praecox]
MGTSIRMADSEPDRDGEFERFVATFQNLSSSLTSPETGHSVSKTTATPSPSTYDPDYEFDGFAATRRMRNISVNLQLVSDRPVQAKQAAVEVPPKFPVLAAATDFDGPTFAAAAGVDGPSFSAAFGAATGVIGPSFAASTAVIGPSFGAAFGAATGVDGPSFGSIQGPSLSPTKGPALSLSTASKGPAFVPPAGPSIEGLATQNGRFRFKISPVVGTGLKAKPANHAAKKVIDKGKVFSLEPTDDEIAEINPIINFAQLAMSAGHPSSSNLRIPAGDLKTARPDTEETEPAVQPEPARDEIEMSASRTPSYPPISNLVGPAEDLFKKSAMFDPQLHGAYSLRPENEAYDESADISDDPGATSDDGLHSNQTPALTDGYYENLQDWIDPSTYDVPPTEMIYHPQLNIMAWSVNDWNNDIPWLIERHGRAKKTLAELRFAHARRISEERTNYSYLDPTAIFAKEREIHIQITEFNSWDAGLAIGWGWILQRLEQQQQARLALADGNMDDGDYIEDHEN